MTAALSKVFQFHKIVKTLFSFLSLSSEMLFVDLHNPETVKSVYYEWTSGQEYVYFSLREL